MALILIAVATVMQRSGNAGTLRCNGSPCGPMSGSLLAGFIYLFSIYLVGKSVLYFKTFAFLLTDSTLTTVAGYFYQSSTTFRFERIQDVDTYRGPIHALLGLKTVSIWTASPDQFARNKKRPDGRILLDVESADWLRDFLSNPPAAAGGDTTRGSTVHSPAPRADAGLILALWVAAALAVPAMLIWKATGMVPPGAVSTVGSAPGAASVAGSATPSRYKQHVVASAQSVPAPIAVSARPATPPDTPARAVPADFAIACAIHGSGGINDVIPCAKFAEAQRCQREMEFPSKPTSAGAVLTVANRSDEPIKFYWLNPSGGRALYATLPPGGQVSQQSHIGAHWLLSTQDERCIAIFNAVTMTIGIF